MLAELVRRRLIHRRCVGGHRGGPRDCVRSILGPIREVLPNFDDDFPHHAEQHGVRQRQRYHVPALHHRLVQRGVTSKVNQHVRVGSIPKQRERHRPDTHVNTGAQPQRPARD